MKYRKGILIILGICKIIIATRVTHNENQMEN